MKELNSLIETFTSKKKKDGARKIKIYMLE
ncbi:hypothetical protein FLSI110296_13680 [Flavobacterium sinopsychrotolerans]